MTNKKKKKKKARTCQRGSSSTTPAALQLQQWWRWQLHEVATLDDGLSESERVRRRENEGNDCKQLKVRVFN